MGGGKMRNFKIFVAAVDSNGNVRKSDVTYMSACNHIAAHRNALSKLSTLMSSLRGDFVGIEGVIRIQPV
jgi:hypothetical protein